MKLTPLQIETIEKYLLSWGLEYRDFYEEMLDHFVTDIEQQMSHGTPFKKALDQTKELFNKKKYKGAYGLKAFETEYIHGIQRELKIKLRSKMKEQFTSWRLVLWVTMGLNLLYFYEGNKFVAFAPFAVLIVLGVFVSMAIMFTEQGFSFQSRWTLVDKPIQEQKSKSLFVKTRRRALGLNMVLLFFLPTYLSFFFFNNLNKAGVNIEHIFFIIFFMVLAVASSSMAWAQIELVFSEIKREA